MSSPVSFTDGRFGSVRLLGLAGGATGPGSRDAYVALAGAGITALIRVAPWSARMLPAGGAARLADGTTATAATAIAGSSARAFQPRRSARGDPKKSILPPPVT